MDKGMCLDIIEDLEDKINELKGDIYLLKEKHMQDLKEKQEMIYDLIYEKDVHKMEADRLREKIMKIKRLVE